MSGRLIGELHCHHDHLTDYPNDLLRDKLGSQWMSKLETLFPGAEHFRAGLCRFVERFPHEVICQDCDTAEGAAKQQIQADSYFSFAPPEITHFVTSTPNAKHRIDRDIATSLWRKEIDGLERRKRFVQRAVKALLAGDFWSAGYSFNSWHYHHRTHRANS